MAENTFSLVDVTQTIYDLLDINKSDLGVLDVWYGDQARIPRTPAVAVESGAVNRALAGVGGKGRVENEFIIFLLCYIGKLVDAEVSRKAADTLAESVETVLHRDVTLDGTVIHGFVQSLEPGYSTRQGEVFRVARLTWRGITKTQIV